MPSLKPMIAASEAASTSVPDPLVAFALAAAVTMAIGHAASGRAATQQTKDAAALLPSAALASVWVTSDHGRHEPHCVSTLAPCCLRLKGGGLRMPAGCVVVATCKAK